MRSCQELSASKAQSFQAAVMPIAEFQGWLEPGTHQLMGNPVPVKQEVLTPGMPAAPLIS